MSISISRSYPNAQIDTSNDQLPDIIRSVYCVVYGIDENGVYETIGQDFILSEPNPSDFISFQSINREILDHWITNTDQYISLEQAVKDSIASQNNKIVITRNINL